jgi:hypothetical protein
VHAGFWQEDLRDIGHLEDQDVDGRIVLKCVFKKLDEDMDWVDLVQDRYKLRAVVNTVMNLRVR